MNVIKEPSTYNLSSMMSDFIISSSEDVLFEVRLDNKTILKERYTPDNENMIYIRGRALGSTLKKYLSGNDLKEGIQYNISKQFTVLINNELYGTYYVLKSNSIYTELPFANFFDGSVFLNLFNKIKWVTPTSKEYLTCVLGVMVNLFVKVNVIYREDNEFKESELKDFSTSISTEFETFDVSFSTVASKFTEIDEKTIVAYKLHTKNQVSTYYVDRSNYIRTLEFVYKNSFDVPETITAKGAASRKGIATFESYKMNDIVHKSNIRRSDLFTVSSGKIYSNDEYNYYREMFNSTDVHILFMGKYRRIIITEENSVQSLRNNNLSPVSFSFQFADEYENNVLLGDAFYEWILTNGEWIDTNQWMDTGIWKDAVI